MVKKKSITCKFARITVATAKLARRIMEVNGPTNAYSCNFLNSTQKIARVDIQLARYNLDFTFACSQNSSKKISIGTP